MEKKEKEKKEKNKKKERRKNEKRKKKSQICPIQFQISEPSQMLDGIDDNHFFPELSENKSILARTSVHLVYWNTSKFLCIFDHIY